MLAYRHLCYINGTHVLGYRFELEWIGQENGHDTEGWMTVSKDMDPER
jgi:hypothetical protein